MKNFLHRILKVFAKKILNKYKPKVIGITGSIGKTSTKEAILAVLNQGFTVRASMKNYNNEIGVPLVIIGSLSPGKSIIGWLNIFLKAIWLLIYKNKNYPRVLVLEMAADKAGDIKYLTQLAPCDIGVLTNIGPSHLEYFKTIEKIIKEKKIIVTHLAKDKTAIINIDDDNIKTIKDSIKSKVLTYGTSEDADLKVIELETSGKGLDVDGIKFKLMYKGSAVPIFLPYVIGHNSIMAALAGASVGVAMGMNIVDISEGLRKYKTPRGRMNLINGIKNSLIIDDTYNASPESTIAALETLNKFDIDSSSKKIAILGNMLELGSLTEKGHEDVGKKAAELGFDLLITVGELGLIIAKSAVNAGMDKSKVFSFDYSQEAGRFLQDRMKQGDLILVKGSQGVRMEHIVKEIMAEPLRAKELLVRQGEAWKS